MTTEARTAQPPSLAIAVLLVILPIVTVLQYRGLAPATAIAFAATVILHRLARGTWPWPSLSGPLLPAFAIGALAVASGLWAFAPLHAVIVGLKYLGFLLLGAAAAQAVAEDPEAPRLIPRALCIGIGVLGVLAAADMLSNNAIRAAVRTARARTDPFLITGLKPAVTLLGVLLPMVAAERATTWYWRLAIIVAGLAAAVIIPAETAKISVVVGLLVWALARFVGPAMGTVVGAGLAVAIVATPLFLSFAMPRLPSLEGRPMSAVHRVLIWDFTLQRMADRPTLGWGADGSRFIPGGSDHFPTEALERFGLNSPYSRRWFTHPGSLQLSLHPHNAALQVWLEFGPIGALLAAWLAFALGRAAGRLSPGATGSLAAGAVTAMLSYGVWQEWWIGSILMLAIIATALGAAARAGPPGGAGSVHPRA